MLNILLITADQWRGDSLGYAGHNMVRTPNLDALAADGTAFLNHYANAAPCSPARACLYTGLYQMNNRVVVNGAPLADRFDNIARAARRAGYTPTLFGYTDQAADPTVTAPDDPALTSYEGVLPGFDARVRLPEHEKAWLSWLRQQGLDFADRDLAHLPVERVGEITSAPPAYDRHQTQTAFITGEFIRWLGEQDHGRPWFAHVSFLRPHPPFIVPAPYNRMYDPADVPSFVQQPSASQEADTHPLMRLALAVTGAEHFVPGRTGPVAALSDGELRQIKATYYGMITEVDDQLGRLFAAIKSAGVWNDTLIVFTSDHAEMMGDHHTLGKGGFYDQSQHIPLIIRDPGATLRGQRVEAFTEAVDIFPTLLDFIGVGAKHVADGASLSPMIAAPSTPHRWRDAVHWEFDFRDVAGQSAEQALSLSSTELNMSVVRTAEWKYVHFAAMPPLLFDLRADPHCLHNVADDPAFATMRIEMAERLLSWRARHLDQTLALKALTADGVASVPRRDIG